MNPNPEGKKVRIIPKEMMEKHYPKVTGGIMDDANFSVISGIDIGKLCISLYRTRNGGPEDWYSDAQIQDWIDQIEKAKQKACERADKIIEILKSTL